MNYQRVEFVLGAARATQFPLTESPEIAFVGRSNVGKSSLLNGFLGRKKLVHVSKKPGKTAQLNFFHIDRQLMVVDTPGYGYAQTSKALQHMWDQVIPAYFQTRIPLIHTFVLVDSRHPVKPSDLQTMEWLIHQGREFSVIMTKIDKVSRELLSDHQMLIQQFLLRRQVATALLLFSVKTPLHTLSLRAFVEDLLIPRLPSPDATSLPLR